MRCVFSSIVPRILLYQQTSTKIFKMLHVIWHIGANLLMKSIAILTFFNIKFKKLYMFRLKHVVHVFFNR